MSAYSRHIRLDKGRVEPRAGRAGEQDELEFTATTLYVSNLDKSNSKETIYAVSELAEGLLFSLQRSLGTTESASSLRIS